MATSAVQIANLALTRVGHDTISSLTEGSKAARMCNLHYEPSRDAVLEAHLWNFAIKRVALSQLTTPTPAFGFAYYYQLPSDFLRMVRTENDELGYFEEYRIESSSSGTVLATDQGEVSIEYVAKVSDPTQFPALFTDLLAQRLAAEISMAMTDNQAATEKVWQIYETKLREARYSDAVQGTPRDIIADTWTNSRI